MSEEIKHPALTLLGAPVVTTDGDFRDLAQATTPLGEVNFTRCGNGTGIPRPNDQWSFHWMVVHREVDDFDSFEGEKGVGLEGAVAIAERMLNGVLRRAAAALNAPYSGGAVHHIEQLHLWQREALVREQELVERVATLVELLDKRATRLGPGPGCGDHEWPAERYPGCAECDAVPWQADPVRDALTDLTAASKAYRARVREEVLEEAARHLEERGDAEAAGGSIVGTLDAKFYDAAADSIRLLASQVEITFDATPEAQPIKIPAAAVIEALGKDRDAHKARADALEEQLSASRREIDRIAEGERLEADGLHSLETENAKLRADNVDLKKEVDDYQHQLNGLNEEGLTMDKERKALEDKLAAIKAIVAEPPTTKVCGARGGGSHQYEWRCERREHHTGECDPDEKLAKAADHHDKHGRTHNENASKYERICRILGA